MMKILIKIFIIHPNLKNKKEVIEVLEIKFQVKKLKQKKLNKNQKIFD